ncbi:hypothetical protein HDU92_008014 [Lobulomyces angularis]|nr:hypothetical protein HDU92_008014 [Lobulomyces angularis]
MEAANQLEIINSISEQEESEPQQSSPPTANTQELLVQEKEFDGVTQNEQNNSSNNNNEEPPTQIQPQNEANSIPVTTNTNTVGGTLDLTRENRIQTRKARIQATRLAKTRTENAEEIAAMLKPTSEPERKDAGKSKNQIIQSKKRADAIKLHSTEEVTTVKAQVTAREAQRRLEEVRKIELKEERRKEEQKKSIEIQQRIEAEWEKSFNMKLPFELRESLLIQKAACDEAITIKNKLCNEFISELKIKDDEYVKELKRQAEEIDSMLGKMETQYKAFQNTLNEEINQIDRAFVEERTESMQANNAEIEKIFVSRRENERKFMEERADRIEDHISQLEQLRIQDAEEYNLVKIKLETDVKVLEQQLQQMRGTYQLNTEKLDYNFQVLKKREEENGTILSAQKRKMSRLTDHLNTLKIKIGKQEKTFHSEYLALTEDYKRITEQFKELQKKFRHFQIADSKKYKEIWAMNEEIAKEKMRKVLQADRIIHEQQLGLEWNPPDEEIFSTVEPSPIADIKQFHKQPEVSKLEKETGAAAHLIAAASLNEEMDDEEVSFKETFGLKLSKKGYSKTMKKMLELLCNEAGFLVEERLQKLLAPLHKDEQSLMKLDSIFKAIGVSTVEDIEHLTSYFIQTPVYDKHQSSTENSHLLKLEAEVNITSPHLPIEPETEGSKQHLNNLQLSKDEKMLSSTEIHNDLTSHFIGPNEVVKAIRRFAEDTRNEKERMELESSSSMPSLVKNTVSDKKIKNNDFGIEEEDEDDVLSLTEQGKSLMKNLSGVDSGKSQVVCGDQKQKNQECYWEKFGKIVNDSNYRTWSAVYVGMEKYNQLLSERWQLTQEIGSVSRQNEELRQLLRQYMSAEVNDELQVPPTKIMLAQAGLLH